MSVTKATGMSLCCEGPKIPQDREDMLGRSAAGEGTGAEGHENKRKELKPAGSGQVAGEVAADSRTRSRLLLSGVLCGPKCRKPSQLQAKTSSLLGVGLQTSPSMGGTGTKNRG